MPYGAIYIAHNPRDGDNVFKVGKTERAVEERMKQLTSSTSNLGTYSACEYFVVNDMDAAEEACHKHFAGIVCKIIGKFTSCLSDDLFES